MKLTRYDKRIGSIRAGTIEIASRPDDAQDYRYRRSDTHQMTWNQLCRYVGRHYSGWRYRVTTLGMRPLDALLGTEKHKEVE